MTFKDVLKVVYKASTNIDTILSIGRYSREEAEEKQRRAIEILKTKEKFIELICRMNNGKKNKKQWDELYATDWEEYKKQKIGKQ